MIEPTDLEYRLRLAFPDAQLEITDLTGTKDHYQALIVSSSFEGLSPIEQHKRVYAVLAEELKGPIHALALKTYTPLSWAKSGGAPPKPAPLCPSNEPHQH